MSTSTVSNPEDIDRAVHEKNASLARYVIDEILSVQPKVILEAGCGKGQFTIPFLSSLQYWEKWVGVDNATGDYEGDTQGLTDKIERISKGKDLSLHLFDLTKGIDEDFPLVDLVISHEFLCDLHRSEIDGVLGDLWRVLRTGGQMIHSVLDPKPSNRSQELLIALDRSPTLNDDRGEWFSPTSEEVNHILLGLEAREVSTHHFTDTVLFEGDAAFVILEQISSNRDLMEDLRPDIERHGVEFPIEYIITAKKG